MTEHKTAALPAWRVAIAAVVMLLFGSLAWSGTVHAKAAEGSPLEHFSAVDMDGKPFDTKTLAGKVLLIDFWSIYCSSCIQEMPHIVDLYNKYNSQGLEVIGVDLDVYGAKRVRKFMKGLKFTIPYPNIIDKKMEIKNLLGVSMLPTTVIVDTTGVVRLVHIGYKPGFEKELEEEIKKYLPAGE